MKISSWRSSWPRTLRLLLPLVLALSLDPGLPLGGSALANTSCAGSSLNLDGPWKGNNSVWGAHAYLTTRQAPLCTGSSGSWNIDSAFAMVQADPTQADGYAQTGYAEVDGQYSTMQWYAEYKPSNGSYVRELAGNTGLTGSPSTGSQHLYTVAYEPTYGDEGMWIDNSEVMYTNFDPACTNGCGQHWPGPWWPQWTGEAHDTGDNIAGTSSAHASYTSMGIQTSQGGTYSTPSGLSLFQDNPNCYNGAFSTYLDESGFDIWDNGGSGC